MSAEWTWNEWNVCEINLSYCRVYNLFLFTQKVKEPTRAHTKLPRRATMASIVSPGVGQSPPLPRLPSCHVTVARRSTAHFVDFTELAASTWRSSGLRREHTIAGYPPDTDRTEVSANTPDIGVATGVPARMLHFPPSESHIAQLYLHFVPTPSLREVACLNGFYKVFE